MRKRRSKLIEALLWVEHLIAVFDKYFDPHSPPPTIEEIIFPKFKTAANYFVEKGVLSPKFSFRKKPQDLIKFIFQPWDKKWTFVFFDIPEKQATIRKRLRSRLWSLGFRPLQRSVWLSPLPLLEPVKKLDKQIDDFAYLAIVRGKIYRDNPKEIITQKWEIDEWKEEAKNWNQTVQMGLGTKARLEDEFWEIILKHPMVPIQLLPQPWPLKTMILNWIELKRS